MIVTETLTINGRKLIKTYSDKGYQIQQVGTNEIYGEAIDPADSKRTYIETDILIEISDETDIEDILDIILGE